MCSAISSLKCVQYSHSSSRLTRTPPLASLNPKFPVHDTVAYEASSPSHNTPFRERLARPTAFGGLIVSLILSSLAFPPREWGSEEGFGKRNIKGLSLKTGILSLFLLHRLLLIYCQYLIVSRISIDPLLLPFAPIFYLQIHSSHVESPTHHNGFSDHHHCRLCQPL